MENMKAFYILGQPIETKIGTIRFIKVKEYPQFVKLLGYLSLEKSELLKMFKRLSEIDEGAQILFNFLKDKTMFEFVKEIGKYQIFYYGLDQIYNGYVELFKFCFNEDVFHKIETNDEFEYYKELIHEMNAIPYEKPNPNPEIEKFNKMRRLLKQSQGESISFEAMYTSVWTFLGHRPDEMTLYQFHKLFNRIAQFKNFDITSISALFSEKQKIEWWFKDIVEKQEEQYLDEKDLNTRKNL